MGFDGIETGHASGETMVLQWTNSKAWIQSSRLQRVRSKNLLNVQSFFQYSTVLYCTVTDCSLRMDGSMFCAGSSERCC